MSQEDKVKVEEKPRPGKLVYLAPEEIEPRYQEHLRRVAGPKKVNQGGR